MKKILNILLMGTTLGCCVGAYKAFAIDFTKLTRGLGILGNDMSGGSWNISKVGSGLSNLGYSIKKVKDGGSYLLQQVGLGGVTKTVGTNAANQSMKIGFSEAVRLTNGDVSQLDKLASMTTEQAAKQAAEQGTKVATNAAAPLAEGALKGMGGDLEKVLFLVSPY